MLRLRTILLGGRKADFDTGNNKSEKISAVDLMLSDSGEKYHIRPILTSQLIVSTNQGAEENS